MECVCVAQAQLTGAFNFLIRRANDARGPRGRQRYDTRNYIRSHVRARTNCPGSPRICARAVPPPPGFVGQTARLLVEIN